MILMAIFLAYGLALAAEQASGDASAGTAKAENCIACHNALISLKDRGADTIGNQIKAIRAGSRGHPPGLADLSDEDIADIAAYLNDF